MSYRKLILRSALIVAIFIASGGTICQTAFAVSPGWPTGSSPTPVPTPPPTPTPSPTPFPTPTPITALPTPVPPAYVQVITVESPQLQYRDGSSLPNAQDPYGPFTAVVSMYLNSNDPTQFEVVRTFQPRFPGNVYGAAQPVSSPTVSASYTRSGQLANNVTALTVYPHPENPYGKDTLTVYTVDSRGNIILPALTPGSIPILVYPVSTAKIYNSLSFVSTPTPTSSPSAAFATFPPSTTSASPYPNPSPYPIPYPSPTSGATPFVTPNPLVNFSGDTARIDVEIDNAYPGGTTWVVVYPGAASGTLPSSAREVANSRLTAPTTDLVAERDVFIEVGTATNTVGGPLFPASTTPTAYTVQVIQFRPPYGGSDGMETLATASFTVVSSSFKVNSQVGKLTP
jgi:hypothetical protein